jgi:hypothetical protein
MAFVRKEAACFLCGRNRNLAAAFQISKAVCVYMTIFPHSTNCQRADQVSLAWVQQFCTVS